jgi:hypothetical protein
MCSNNRIAFLLNKVTSSDSEEIQASGWFQALATQSDHLFGSGNRRIFVIPLKNQEHFNFSYLNSYWWGRYIPYLYRPRPAANPSGWRWSMPGIHCLPLNKRNPYTIFITIINSYLKRSAFICGGKWGLYSNIRLVYILQPFCRRIPATEFEFSACGHTVS